jgi:hypothetical protein
MIETSLSAIADGGRGGFLLDENSPNHLSFLLLVINRRLDSTGCTPDVLKVVVPLLMTRCHTLENLIQDNANRHRMPSLLPMLQGLTHCCAKLIICMQPIVDMPSMLQHLFGNFNAIPYSTASIMEQLSCCLPAVQSTNRASVILFLKGYFFFNVGLLINYLLLP